MEIGSGLLGLLILVLPVIGFILWLLMGPGGKSSKAI